MKNQPLLLPTVIVTFTGVTLMLSAQQETDKAADRPSAAPIAAPAPATEATDPPPEAPGLNRPARAATSAKLAYGLDEIAKMVAAGVDPEVVQAFIEHSTIAYAPNADDIVQLRELGAPSPVIASLIRHGGQLRERGIQESKAAQAQLSQPSTPALNCAAPSSSVNAFTAPPASVTYNVFNSSYPSAAYPVYPTYRCSAPGYVCYPRYSYSYPRYYFPRHYFPSYYNTCYPFADYRCYAPRFVRYGVAVGLGSHRFCRPVPSFHAGI